MPSEYTKEIIVSISDCDAKGQWRPSALLVQMQELAELHSASLGFSRVMLVENGMVWILYRQRVIMHDHPSFGETLRAATWPGAIDGPIFPRHFSIVREDGTPVAEATTSWILIDIKTRRPLRPSALPGTVEPNTERTPPMPLPGMLRIQDAVEIAQRTVQYSDIDVNGHMNNTRYIDWVCDLLDYNTLMARGVAEFQINYISEALPGEALSLCEQDENGATLILGKRAADGRTVFETRIVLG